MQLPDNPAATLAWLIRAKLYAARTTFEGAVDWMAANRAPQQAQRIFKAGVPAASTTDPDFNAAVSAFMGSAKTASALLRLLADNAVVRVPLRTRVMITTAPGVAVGVAEGAAKPLHTVDWTTVVLPTAKAVASAVFSDELWSDLSGPGQAQFHKDLVAAVAPAIDTVFFDMLTHTGTPSHASSGPTAANAWTDLRTALLATNTSGAARLYWACGPAVASRAATLDAAGIPVFPAAPNELANYPLLVTSGCPVNELYLLDGTGICANADTIIPRVTTQADMLLADNPTMSAAPPTPAAMTSMFQTNCVGLQVEAFFGAQTLRDTAVHVTTGINWGG